jgi:hypothetical protein
MSEPQTNDQQVCEELLANGWKPIHASPFWQAPNGELFPSAYYAWEQMKQGTGNIKHCTTCGQVVNK